MSFFKRLTQFTRNLADSKASENSEVVVVSQPQTQPASDAEQASTSELDSMPNTETNCATDSKESEPEAVEPEPEAVELEAEAVESEIAEDGPTSEESESESNPDTEAFVTAEGVTESEPSCEVQQLSEQSKIFALALPLQAYRPLMPVGCRTLQSGRRYVARAMSRIGRANPHYRRLHRSTLGG